MADQTVLIMAKRGGKYIAGALNLVGDNAIFGRHWGCCEDHPLFYIFELCYYQAIEYAIQNGLNRVEAGAPGRAQIGARVFACHHSQCPLYCPPGATQRGGTAPAR